MLIAAVDVALADAADAADALPFSPPLRYMIFTLRHTFIAPLIYAC